MENAAAKNNVIGFGAIPVANNMVNPAKAADRKPLTN
jgi:hypothetical protein